ncbi:PDR/VanB family oxidoreductase [Mesobacillus subterraneus]|uniref:Oxidoreductase n=1 Tax=Mesobacillus subterraneus TaxID=285983 RepID=A0A3R9EUV7_9BACI|nr:PDR/VanB family oxidoreductase [Mesobacillus subterraneus]RSD22329.1 oxidoreductase [Mesobacillus subterraneus]
MQRKPTLKVQVKQITVETDAIKRFTLEAVTDGKLPSFSGGSHLTTFLPHPSGTTERPYSLFSISGSAVYEIAVRLSENSSGGSLYWHQHVHEGDVITVSYPKNSFPLSFQAKHHVFYAAGIGITPFLSMMAELAEKNFAFELHYAAKSKEQCAFYDFLNQAYPGKCHFYFSEGEPAKRLSPVQLEDHPIGTHVYFCGPERFIEDFRTAAKNFGYPSFNVHFERFAAPAQLQRKPFEVTLKHSGKLLDVPADSTLLEVLREIGVNVPYSCRAGGCGTCEIKVEEGDIQHYDSFLTEDQQRSNHTMLCCVSRGKGRLVLDL